MNHIFTGKAENLRNVAATKNGYDEGQMQSAASGLVVQFGFWRRKIFSNPLVYKAKGKWVAQR